MFANVVTYALLVGVGSMPRACRQAVIRWAASRLCLVHGKDGAEWSLHRVAHGQAVQAHPTIT